MGGVCIANTRMPSTATTATMISIVLWSIVFAFYQDGRPNVVPFRR
jgi:hypothetical protein